MSTLLVLTNLPDRAAAEKLADQLLERQVAACVNILPGSFMTGQMFWAYTGGIVMIVGMAVTAFAMRRKSEHG